MFGPHNHHWTEWEERLGYNEDDDWEERYCEDCGTTQQKEEDGTIITLPKEDTDEYRI